MVKMLSLGGTDVRHARKTITFDGTAGLGAVGTAVTIFTTTGKILLHYITAYCTTDLGQALATAQISLGTATQVTRFVAATNSTAIQENEWWVTGTPTVGSIDLPDICQNVFVSENVVINPTAQNTNAGVLVIDAIYEPISDDGSLS